MKSLFRFVGGGKKKKKEQDPAPAPPVDAAAQAQWLALQQQQLLQLAQWQQLQALLAAQPDPGHDPLARRSSLGGTADPLVARSLSAPLSGPLPRQTARLAAQPLDTHTTALGPGGIQRSASGGALGTLQAHGYGHTDTTRDALGESGSAVDGVQAQLQALYAQQPHSSEGGDTDEGRKNVMFVWKAAPETVVEVAGTWDGWAERIPMQVDGWTHFVVLNLARGRYEYKYIVDGRWTHDVNKQRTDDSLGSYSNFFQI